MPLQIKQAGTNPSRAELLRLVQAGATKNGTKQDTSAEDVFEQQCKLHGLPNCVRQFEIAKGDASAQLARKKKKELVWRFDFAFPPYPVIVEIDGGIFMRGGGAHSHPTDIVRNMKKRNDAALAGFHVLSFTPDEVRKGIAVVTTEKFIRSSRT